MNTTGRIIILFLICFLSVSAGFAQAAPDPVASLRNQIEEAATPQDRVRLQLKLADQLVTTGRFVALVKQQVERLQHAFEPSLQFIADWDLKRDVCLLDLLFCACHSFGNRRFSGQESPTDLDNAETAKRF